MSTDTTPDTSGGDGNSSPAPSQGSDAAAPAAGGSGGASPPKSALATMTAKMGPPSSTPPATDALNSQIVQAVQLTNAENAAYGPNQVALAPNMMITQASGLVAQSAAAYFDGASKMVLASKSVLLKDMTEKFAEQNLKGAAEDALGILITDLLMGTAAAVAAAAGAIEAESAHFSLDKIDQSIEKYHSTLGSKG